MNCYFVCDCRETNLSELMSLAGGSYLGLSDNEEAADPGSKTDLPCVAMPNILDQCYVQKNQNQNRSPQRWPNAGGKTPTTNGKKDGQCTVAYHYCFFCKSCRLYMCARANQWRLFQLTFFWMDLLCFD